MSSLSNGLDVFNRLAGKNLQARAINVAKTGAPNAALDLATNTPMPVEIADKVATDLMITKALAQKYGPVWNGIRAASKYAPRVVGTAFRLAPPTALAANLYAIGSTLHDFMQNPENVKEVEAFNSMVNNIKDGY